MMRSTPVTIRSSSSPRRTRSSIRTTWSSAQPGATAAVSRKNVQSGQRRSLQPARPGTYGGVATPWGLELSGLWSRYTWAKGTRWYYLPVRISLQSVGPGDAPSAASFAIALDPNVVQDVRIGKARLNHKAQAHRSTLPQPDDPVGHTRASLPRPWPDRRENLNEASSCRRPGTLPDLYCADRMSMRTQSPQVDEDRERRNGGMVETESDTAGSHS
jgi:hypothetical protein